MRTVKEELIWLNEFGSLEEARERIEDWIRNYYNRVYVHSSSGYLSPEEYELKHYEEQNKECCIKLYKLERKKVSSKMGCSTLWEGKRLNYVEIRDSEQKGREKLKREKEF